MSAFDVFEKKMLAAGSSTPAISSFRRNFEALCREESGMISEESIVPATGLPIADDLDEPASEDLAKLISQSVVIKLNGGLGTGMGLEKAKSLLRVKGDQTFLDLIARQILHLRESTGSDGLRFLLMNSFSTSEDTLSYLEAYSELGGKEQLELMQSQVPRIVKETREPLSFVERPALEWCPPGHGDIYASLLGSGKLDELLDEGIRYAFVSNSDNLGATLDPKLLGYFAASEQPFMMEVTRRTASDRKGGHLAERKSDGQLLLRESAQCADEDEAEFQNIDKHQYFNTNNLWVRLDRLKLALEKGGGLIPLPMIQNEKTADPRDKKSTPVIQLETAMGAAIECFVGAGALVVSRKRFAPVKTTSDLLGLRSDAYVQTEDHRLELVESLGGTPPEIKLDADDYKLVDGLENAIEKGVPSLVACEKLSISGPVKFEPGVIFKGEIVIENSSTQVLTIASGEYHNQKITG